ncbi:MAG: hypothetical protein ACXU9C_30175, partial [Xanthobacteraceae bacterium]
MSTSQKDSDAVLERARVREVTGVFRSRLALDVAAGELLLMGFDRADIDVVAGVDEIYKKLGVPYVAPEELADVPRVPRRPLVVGEDVTVFTILIAGTLGAIAAGATIYLMSFSDAGSAEIVVAAALVAIVAAGAGFLLAARIFRQDEARGLDALMAERGLILWVRARSPEQEALAQEILLSHRAEAVRVHEIELEKRPEDLPLG